MLRRRWWRAAARDQRGVAAVEFAILAPVLILLYCGLAEITLGLMAGRRAAHAASVTGDLVAQAKSVTTADLTDIFKVGDAIQGTAAASALKIRLTSVTADAKGVPKVDWSVANRTTPDTPKSTVPGFPAGLLVSPGDSMIMSEVSYAYVSPLHYVLPSGMSFSQAFYLKPRRSIQVPCGDCPTS